MEFLFEIEKTETEGNTITLYPGIPKIYGQDFTSKSLEIRDPEGAFRSISSENILLLPNTGNPCSPVLIIDDDLPDLAVRTGDRVWSDPPPLWRRDLRRFLCPITNPLLGVASIFLGMEVLLKREYEHQGVTSTGFTAIIGGLFLVLMGTAFLLSVCRWWFGNYKLEKIEVSIMLTGTFLFVVFVLLRLAEAYGFI